MSIESQKGVDVGRASIRRMGIFKAMGVSGLLATVCLGVVTHTTVTYKPTIKRISGRVVGYGAVNPGARIRVFDKPEVWANDSLSLVDKRQRQTEIASTVTDEKGKFDFRRIPKGAYEVEFSRDGWNFLSVIVNVDPSGTGDRICVQMSLDGMGPDASVQACH